MSGGANANRLYKLFESVVYGGKPLARSQHHLFLQAIVEAYDLPATITKLLASEQGIPRMQEALRSNLDIAFYNGPAAIFLKRLSDPVLENISAGDYLNRLAIAIADPPIFWDPFCALFNAGQLSDDGQIAFSWLLYRLLSLPNEHSRKYLAQADENLMRRIKDSQNPDVRSYAAKIRHVLEVTSTRASVLENTLEGPGGRHDNDFADFRNIIIVPTPDELVSKDTPFLRTAASLDDIETTESRAGIHLDNQFRLYREDMLFTLREDVQVSLGMKKARRRAFILDGLSLTGIYTKSTRTSQNIKFGFVFSCPNGIPQLEKIKPAKRQKHLSENPDILRHLSLTCIVINNNEPIGFPTIYRDEQLLAGTPPSIVLQLDGEESVRRMLKRLETATSIKVVYIDTALFAYQPVLQALQEKKVLPLSEELLHWSTGVSLESPATSLDAVVHSIRRHGHDLQHLLQTPNPIHLDDPQQNALVSGLTQRVSVIQGPPGTGKSFVGALLAKVIHDYNPDSKILVVCYTNHALDQFLEDLMDVGIPHDSMVRVGGKSTSRTEDLALQKLSRAAPRAKRTQLEWDEIRRLKEAIPTLSQELEDTAKSLLTQRVTYDLLFEHLLYEHPDYYEAFEIPTEEDGMQRVGRGGKNVDETYLLHRWINGWNAGMYTQADNVSRASRIWRMLPEQRAEANARWLAEMRDVSVEEFAKLSTKYDTALEEVDRRFSAQDVMVLRSKRIIGCTTTGAAKYRRDIQAASPTVVLVEEAGEILESHVLTAMGPNTDQLILIGDHKQLRPKVNTYQLTVEKGEGYDLNRSLFERLVLKGFPHTTLLSQHRMRPEISSLVRQLTYPELQDAPKTRGRDHIRGIQSDIVFIAHEKPEDEDLSLKERRDGNAKSSKQNLYEAKMILKIVKYLGQQGYGTDDIVILTPYLGQLRQLQQTLIAENDPVLNDLDSHDLVAAGLISPMAATAGQKRRIRLATIDNYQGEESDIVLASLTRSNPDHDIGFMSAHERLNVLISRARNGMILLGNMETFQHARKGGEMWQKFFGLLRDSRQIFEGLPVKCERHPARQTLLRRPEDFERDAPDGGCLQPCNAMLSCGKHTCPSMCHQLSDHSKMQCLAVLHAQCPNNHKMQWQCFKGPPLQCQKCEREKKRAEEQQRQDFQRQEARDEAQREHLATLARIEKELEVERDRLRDNQLGDDMQAAIERKKEEVENARRLADEHQKSRQRVDHHASLQASTTSTTTNPIAGPSNPVKRPASDAEALWEHQKNVEGAVNQALDEIMALSGLEEVKAQILAIKSKIDASLRQNISLKHERLGVSMLGNPGTGKTTIARLYGKFLAIVGAVPGSCFEETTGSRLANDGVDGVQKLIKNVEEGGGGVIFIDEAYQLTSEHNFEGKKVLDFLLAEMEDQRGKIVFAFAGYEKEMEKFFEHNPGIPSRVPYTLKFRDYDDAQLHDMLAKHVDKTWKGRMQVEDGIYGLYGRICIRRLGRGRGRAGFGNARALENVFSGIKQRQAVRLAQERASGGAANDFIITKEDLIGEDPATVMTQSSAWKKLKSMIGLVSVKDSVQNLFDMSISNYKRELLEKQPNQVSLNRCYLGNPGTGKTTVAKLYGQILSELNLLSKGNEVVVKNPADFVGSVLGETEKNAKGILDNTIGKVLIIDEAYMFYSSANGGSDMYKTAAIDTIVAEVQSTPGEDRCVLLLGYRAPMEEMFQKSNPGLARRFAIENAFEFADYTDDELRQALEWKLKDQDLTAVEAAKDVAIQLLNRERMRPNFGNIGAVENLLSQAKTRYQQRQSRLPVAARSPDAPFVEEDFDPDYQRHLHAGANLAKLFEDVIGCERIVKQIEGWQQMSKNVKDLGKDPSTLVPTTFVFKGPAGTGKTTTARKMGQVYYDMGILSKAEVVECAASDLVGQYVGQTGPKTVTTLEKALGKVLFVDEAYRLSEGHFAKEAMDELVGCLTQQRFRGKLIVILAGYDREMNELMSVNSGLSSRFPNEILFENLTPRQAMSILRMKLKLHDACIPEVADENSPVFADMMQLMDDLSALPGWGNARDVETMAKSMALAVLSSTSTQKDAATGLFLVPGSLAVQLMQERLTNQRDRTSNLPTGRPRAFEDLPTQSLDPGPQSAPPPPSIAQPKTKTAEKKKKPAPAPTQSPGPSEGVRDAGVSDQVWNALQDSKRRAREVEEQAKKAEKEKKQEAVKAAQRLKAAQDELKRAQQKKAAEAELMRLREKERLRRVAEAEAKARLEAAREAERKRQREEAQVQQKIRQMGQCVQGFNWIKESYGYRCAGGSHFLTNSQLGI